MEFQWPSWVVYDQNQSGQYSKHGLDKVDSSIYSQWQKSTAGWFQTCYSNLLDHICLIRHQQQLAGCIHVGVKKLWESVGHGDLNDDGDSIVSLLLLSNWTKIEMLATWLCWQLKFCGFMHFRMGIKQPDIDIVIHCAVSWVLIKNLGVKVKMVDTLKVCWFFSLLQIV